MYGTLGMSLTRLVLVLMLLLGTLACESRSRGGAFEARAQHEDARHDGNKDVREQLARLQAKVTDLERQSLDATAHVDLTGASYVAVHAGVAPLLIAFVDAGPAESGARATLSLGNITAASFEGVTLTLKYNRRFPESPEDALAWGEATRVVKSDVPVNIKPGSWARVQVILPGIQPAELGYLRIGARLDALELSN